MTVTEICHRLRHEGRDPHEFATRVVELMERGVEFSLIDAAQQFLRSGRIEV